MLCHNGQQVKITKVKQLKHWTKFRSVCETPCPCWGDWMSSECLTKGICKSKTSKYEHCNLSRSIDKWHSGKCLPMTVLVQSNIQAQRGSMVIHTGQTHNMAVQGSNCYAAWYRTATAICLEVSVRWMHKFCCVTLVHEKTLLLICHTKYTLKFADCLLKHSSNHQFIC